MNTKSSAKYKEDQHHLPALKICQDCCNGDMKIGRLCKEGLKQITRYKTCSCYDNNFSHICALKCTPLWELNLCKGNL